MFKNAMVNVSAVLGAAVVALAAPASAATVQLDSINASGSNYVFSYGGTLSPTEGLTSGSQLIVYDFKGYVPGSVFSPYANVVASTQATTTLPGSPGYADDPAVPDLVFTYTGPDFQATPGNYNSINFTGLTAKSIYASYATDGFTALTIKNVGMGTVGTNVYSQGAVGVPDGAVPEPASWAMMLVGFGGMGAVLRSGRKSKLAIA